MEVDMVGRIKQLDGKLLKVQDVAKMLGLSPARIRQMANEGIIPAAKTVGGDRIFCISDIEKHIADKAAQNGTNRK